VVNGTGVRPGLLFFCRLRQGGLGGGANQEAGDELVGEPAEAEMDLLLKGGKAAGVFSQPLRPLLLLLLQLGLDARQGLLGGWHRLP
jgi:hypothetical protein